jgi:hypothetical protein
VRLVQLEKVRGDVRPLCCRDRAKIDQCGVGKGGPERLTLGAPRLRLLEEGGAVRLLAATREDDSRDVFADDVVDVLVDLLPDWQNDMVRRYGGQEKEQETY